MISVFGAGGFIGSNWCKKTKFEHIVIPRQKKKPKSSDVLYFISTTDNYNVFVDPQLDINTNLITLMATLRTLKEGDIFNYISSWFVYGQNDEYLSNEMSTCKPKGFYSITKLAAEQLIESYCKTKGIHYRIMRLSNIYGPGDNPTKKKNAIQFMINELKSGRKIELYYGGYSVRDLLHVDDCVRAIDLCLKKQPIDTILNVGSGREHRVGRVIGMAKNLLNSRSEIASVNPPDFHKLVQVRDFRMDVTKLKSLGFEPKIEIEEGVKELCSLPMY